MQEYLLLPRLRPRKRQQQPEGAKLIEWMQENVAWAEWIALPLAAILAVIGWFAGVRPAIARRRVSVRQTQRGGRGSINVQIAQAKEEKAESDE